MTSPGAITIERSRQELILRMIERQILHCLLGPRQRRMIRGMTTPCGRGRIAISIGSNLTHQEVNGSLDYDQMKRCQAWQEILQTPTMLLVASRASMRAKEMQ